MGMQFYDTVSGTWKYVSASNPLPVTGAGGGSGTVTSVGNAALTSTALVTGGGLLTVQTPSATSTLDSAGNMVLAGKTTATEFFTTPVAGTTGTTNVIVAGESITFATFVNGTTTTLTLPTSPVANDYFFVYINGANGSSTLTTSATVYREGDSSSGTVITPNQVAAANAKHVLKFWYDGTIWWYSDTFSAATNLGGTGAGGVTGTLPVANGGTGIATIGVFGSRFESNGTIPSWDYPGKDFRLEEDFTPVNGSSGQLPIKWSGESLVAGGSAAQATGTFAHPGVILITSGITATNGYVLRASDSGTPGWTALNGSLAGNTNWHVTFVFQLGPTEGNTTSDSFKVGLAGSAAVADEYANWFGLRFNTALSDTNFMFCTRAASAYGIQTSTAIAADNAWHRLDITSTAAGTIIFALDGGTPVSTSSAVMTSTAVFPFFQIINNATSTARTLNADYFNFVAQGLNR